MRFEITGSDPAAAKKAEARLKRALGRHVMIGTPTARAPVLEYTRSFASTLVHLDRSGIRFATHFVIGSSNLPNARNIIAAQFLASPCTDLIYIDDDMGWKPEAVIRLLASEQPVIAAVGRMKVDKPNSDPEVWCFDALTDAEMNIPSPDEMGAIEVKAVGTAFMKIERCVFERLASAHPEWKREGPKSAPDKVKARYYQFFRFDVDDVTEMGEDFVFCRRWRDLGGGVFIDPHIELTHVGTKAWPGCVAEIMSAEPAAVA